MKRIIGWGVALSIAGCIGADEEASGARPRRMELAAEDGGVADDDFELRVVRTGLASPFEVIWGPDDVLWITERSGKRVVRLHPPTNTLRTALTIEDAVQSGGQDGVLGLALHPGLLRGEGNDYAYVAYTYDADPSDAVDRRVRIARYSYDATSRTLSDQQVLLEGLPASLDHDSGKLRFGPDAKLYYTIGDQGHNQFDYKCQVIHAQDLPTAEQLAASDWSSYQGKILRLNLDGTIPDDNPVIAGVRSHVYSYGHRNPQGIAFGRDGRLYAAEHGPKSDDELNLIEPGRNYGWPHVAGYLDDQAYVYGNWSASPECEALTFSDYVLPPSVPQQRESEWSHPDFTPPLLTFYTVENDFDFMDPACAGDSAYICWPTIAPSSLELYEPDGEGIPGWNHSLLLTSLKEGSVFRVPLSADGASVTGPGIPYLKTTNRYRDLAVTPDGRTIYVITDSQGDTSGPTQGSTMELEHRGAVLEYRLVD